jgi:MFS family permease
LRVFGWRDPAILTLALIAVAVGFGQFGVVAGLGDVSRTFGHQTRGLTIADQAGLSGSSLGVGLAVIRLASLGGLFLTALADRRGRKTTVVATTALGLALTALAAAAPGYWWFIIVFAVGRPALSAGGAIAQVGAAELTSSADRAKAVALIAGGYGVGTGLVAVIHGLTISTLGFRGLLLLALVPLAFLPALSRHMVETDRFQRAAAGGEHPLPVLGPVERPFSHRLMVIAGLAFAQSVVTGPANSFLFVYAQNVRHLSGVLTAAMVVAAGATGLGGLFLGRWLADAFGRRPTAAGALLAMAAFGIVAYSGTVPGLLVGCVLGVLASSTFAPAGGALVNELFPTSVRASVAGWQVAAGVLGAAAGLLAFGAIADATNQFAAAAALTFVPASLAAGLFWAVPETRGKEPEDLYPNLP